MGPHGILDSSADNMHGNHQPLGSRVGLLRTYCPEDPLGVRSLKIK